MIKGHVPCFLLIEFFGDYLFTLFTHFYSASGHKKKDSTFDRAFGLRPSSAAAWPERSKKKLCILFINNNNN